MRNNREEKEERNDFSKEDSAKTKGVAVILLTSIVIEWLKKVIKYNQWFVLK